MSATSSTIDPATLEKGIQQNPDTDSQLNNKTEPVEELPEGGLKAWLTVVGSSAALFVTFGWVNCIGLFQAQYELDQLRNDSSSKIAWITSMEFFCMLFFAPVGGKLFDNYGPRIPLLVGSVMHVFGLMMLSISKEYYQIMLSQSVCSGIGASLIFSPVMTAVQTHFHKKRGIALGLVVAGSSIGGVIFPEMAEHLITQVGFGWAVRACAFLILGMLVVANLTVTSKLEPSPKPFHVMEYLRPFQELNFRIMAVTSFFLYWGMFVVFNYIVTNAIHYGMSQSSAISLVPILNGASFFGRTVPNYYADRVGRFNVMICMTLVSTILILALWLPGHSHGAIIAFSVLFGISSGAGIGLGPVLVGSISPMNELGFRMGAVISVAAFGTLTGPPIAGQIIADDGGRYRYAATFAGVNFAIAVVGLIILRVRLAGWKLSTKV